MQKKKPNLMRFARDFRVSHSRLRARFHGRPSRTTRVKATARLSELQQLALIEWVWRL